MAIQLATEDLRRGIVKTLKEIGLKYNTDKAKHIITRDGMTYLDVYESYFQTLRFEKLNFLELSVLNGSSLRTWREYFPNASINGMDIDPGRLRFASPSENINVDIISQTGTEKLQQYINGKSFDIIIDDASHINRYMIHSFHILFKALKEGGSTLSRTSVGATLISILLTLSRTGRVCGTTRRTTSRIESRRFTSSRTRSLRRSIR